MTKMTYEEMTAVADELRRILGSTIGGDIRVDVDARPEMCHGGYIVVRAPLRDSRWFARVYVAAAVHAALAATCAAWTWDYSRDWHYSKPSIGAPTTWAEARQRCTGSVK